MKRINELREEKGTLYDEYQEILQTVDEEGRSLEEDEEERLDEIEGRMEELNDEIDGLEERRERALDMGEDVNEANEPQVGRRAFEGAPNPRTGFRDSETDAEEVQKRAFRKWLAFGPQSLEGAEQKFVSRSNRREARYDPPDRAAMGTEFRSTAIQVTSTGPAGGDLVPRDFLNELFEDIEDQGNMRDIADVRRTDNGRTIDVPLKRDATAQGEFVSEGSTISTTTEIRYGQEQLQANTVRSGPVKVSFELADDSAFDMEQQVRSELALRISNREETEFVSGTTARTTPVGIETATTGAVGVVGGSSNLTREDLYNLKYNQIKPGWRNMDPVWLVGNGAWFDILNLEDSDGRPLVQPDLQQDDNVTLLGDRVVVSEFVDDFGSSGNKPIFYGSFQNGYMIRDVNQLRLIRFDEKFANEGAVGFQGFMRVDGVPIFGTTSPARKPFRAIVQTT